MPPKYNGLLRDDKSYLIFSLAVLTSRLSMHRGAKKKKGRYFGPYPDSGAVRGRYTSSKRFACSAVAEAVYCWTNLLRVWCTKSVVVLRHVSAQSSLMKSTASLSTMFVCSFKGRIKLSLEAAPSWQDGRGKSKLPALFRLPLLSRSKSAIRRVPSNGMSSSSLEDMDVLGLLKRMALLVSISWSDSLKGKVLGSRSHFLKFPTIPWCEKSRRTEELFKNPPQYYLAHNEARTIPTRLILNADLMGKCHSYSRSFVWSGRS